MSETNRSLPLPIQGKSVRLRFIDVSDAEFILNLRRDRDRACHLTPVPDDVSVQIEWIKKYKERESQRQEFYFVIENLKGERFGAIRIYEYEGKSFKCGSWILRPDAPSRFGLESVLLMYDFAFEVLDCTHTHFEVRKDNQPILRFHDRMGAQILRKDQEFYYYHYSRDVYRDTRKRYEHFLLA
jgi:RimJ/RimL family protein N-acetyltransferase